MWIERCWNIQRYYLQAAIAETVLCWSWLSGGLGLQPVQVRVHQNNNCNNENYNNGPNQESGQDLDPRATLARNPMCLVAIWEFEFGIRERVNLLVSFVHMGGGIASIYTTDRKLFGTRWLWWFIQDTQQRSCRHYSKCITQIMNCMLRDQRTSVVQNEHLIDWVYCCWCN